MNKTAYITHPACLKHGNGEGHLESPERLMEIDVRVHGSSLNQRLEYFEAPKVTREHLISKFMGVY